MKSINSKKGEAKIGLSSSVHKGEINRASVNPTTEIADARSAEMRNTSRTLSTLATRKKNNFTERNRLAATILGLLKAICNCARNSGGSRTQVSTCGADCSDWAT